MKTILACIDGSPRQKGVLAAASELARRAGSKLILFRAVTVPRELPIEAYLMPPEELETILERRAAAALEEAATSVASELLAGTRVGMGEAWKEIVRTGHDDDVDLIVIGSHGHGLLDRLLGTTAARVVNHADRAVLVVRDADRLLADATPSLPSK